MLLPGLTLPSLAFMVQDTDFVSEKAVDPWTVKIFIKSFIKALPWMLRRQTTS